MKKTLILAATALSLATGAAMAQEADAQFLPKSAFTQSVQRSTSGAPVSTTYSVQTHQLPTFPEPGTFGGADGSR